MGNHGTTRFIQISDRHTGRVRLDAAACIRISRI